MSIFYSAPVVLFGQGCVAESKDRLCLGKKAMIVTGKTVVLQNCVKELCEALQNCCVDFFIFSDITGEPDDVMVNMGTDAFEQSKCDFLIAVGGGSPMDAMKAIAVKLKYPESKLRDFIGKEIKGPLVPMIAVPTTAGTGSEVTMFTVITDTETSVKMLLKGAALIPDIAVIDPRYSVSAPANTTANTGLDALTHATEAYASKKAQPLTDTLAKSAVKRIMKYLSKAFDDGTDIFARTQMSLAAYEAGVCITNSSVSIVHGMSRPIGALFHVPHGLSNAMLLPACLDYMLDGAYDRFADLGRAIGVADENTSDKTAAEMFAREVTKLCRYCKVPTLEEYGIGKDEFFKYIDKMSGDAIASGSPANTRKAVSETECRKIYTQLWQ